MVSMKFYPISDSKLGVVNENRPPTIYPGTNPSYIQSLENYIQAKNHNNSRFLLEIRQEYL